MRVLRCTLEKSWQESLGKRPRLKISREVCRESQNCFEVRKPKEHAVISEIDGVVSFGKDTKGKRKVVVTPEVGEFREYLIPKGKISASMKTITCAPENC